MPRRHYADRLTYAAEDRLRRERFAAADLAICLLLLLVHAQDEAETASRRAEALDRKCHALMSGKDAPKVYRKPVQQAALPIRGQDVKQGARVS